MYGGILGHLAEAVDIQRELGVSSKEAWAIQAQRAAERLRKHELQQAEEKADNVVWSVDFAKGKR